MIGGKLKFKDAITRISTTVSEALMICQENADRFRALTTIKVHGKPKNSSSDVYC